LMLMLKFESLSFLVGDSKDN